MTDSTPSTADFKAFLLQLQSDICDELVKLETSGHTFMTDKWIREEGGGGQSRVLEDGDVFERGGVNFSHVVGENLPAAATQHRPHLAGRQFEAMGVSLVIHPRNPHVPTTHMNIRLFFATKKGEAPIWWFGGGYDLTPYYPVKEDVLHWHKTAKQVCDEHDPTLYAKFKKWCDEYFYLKHRDETRGVGGLFFDDFNELGFAKTKAFTQAIGNSFIDAYAPLVINRKDTPYSDEERAFQLYRRGRYVEFNLVYDRGTLFGLQTGGRTESILMSMPPQVEWRYNWSPTPGTPEHELYSTYLKPQNWLNL